MPRKANEKVELKKENNAQSKAKVTSTKTTDTKKTPKTTSVKTTDTKRTPKATSVKTTTTKKTTKVASAKTTAKKKTAKATSTKKTTTKRNSTRNSKKVAETEKIETTFAPEYYDLPQKYNKTVVKLLAQTPKTLFIYWEISDDDIQKYKEQYGDNFFETTKPVLIIHNDTLNYSFEVEINDFANSWYLHVNDSKSDYRVELGRRPIGYNEKIKDNYIYISSSNEIESPNDHILFNNTQKMVYFRNVKTNKEFAKSITTLSFIQNMGKIYDIYDLYLKLYKDEENIEAFSNPSSNMSSQFK